MSALCACSRLAAGPCAGPAGDVFRIEVVGELRVTRMEYSKSEGGYYSIDGFPLHDGMRAAIGEGV